VEEPDGVVAALVEIGARHRLEVGDEVRGGGGADVGAVDEARGGGSGAEAAQEGDGRRVVARAEAAVLRSHVRRWKSQVLFDLPRALELLGSRRGREEVRGGKMNSKIAG